MFYRQIENEIFSKILDHSGGGFSSGHRWGILGGHQGKGSVILILHFMYEFYSQTNKLSCFLLYRRYLDL